MNYLKLTVWIFVFLILLIFLMLFFPSNYVIFLGTAILPVFVVIQVFIILRAKDSSKDRFSDKWYDR